MDYSDTLWVKQQIAQHVTTQKLNEWGRELATEIIECHRGERTAMKAYVDNQAALLRTLIELKEKSFAAELEAQRKIIKSLEARLAARKKDETAPAEYRPSMRKDASRLRLS
jgi:hypothetical protein